MAFHSTYILKKYIPTVLKLFAEKSATFYLPELIFRSSFATFSREKRDLIERIKRNNTPEVVKELQPRNVPSFGHVKEKVKREERHDSMFKGEFYNKSLGYMTKGEKKVFTLESTEPKNWQQVRDEVCDLTKKELDKFYLTNDNLQPKNLMKFDKANYEGPRGMFRFKKFVFPPRLFEENDFKGESREFSTYKSVDCAIPKVFKYLSKDSTGIGNGLSGNKSYFGSGHRYYSTNVGVRKRKGVDYDCPRDCGHILDDKEKKLLEKWNRHKEDSIRIDNIYNDILKKELQRKRQRKKLEMEQLADAPEENSEEETPKPSSRKSVDDDIKKLLEEWNNNTDETPIRIDNILYEIVYKKQYEEKKQKASGSIKWECK